MRLGLNGLIGALVLVLLAGPASAAGRVALVVANASYASAPLTNPLRDADLVSSSLRAIGFDVDTVTDTDLAGFDGAVRRFADKANGAEVALFYFAGHGFAVSDGLKPRNYLLAVEADVASRSDRVLRAGGIPLDEIVGELTGKAAATLVFIDACRNDPRVSRAVGGVGRGLARVDVGGSTNVFVGLSTRLGTVAADGSPGEGSPFARAFATKMVMPGLRLDDAFNEVRKLVSLETERAQQPEVVQNDLDKALVLVSAATAAVDTPPAAAKAPVDGRVAEAAVAWGIIEKSQDAAVLEKFRERYAGTFYADLAAARIAELKAGTQVSDGGEGKKLAALENGTPGTPRPGPGTSVELVGHTAMVREVALTPDGAVAATVSNDGTARLWDARSGKEIANFATNNYLVTISPDGRYVATQNWDALEIREVATGQVTSTLPAEGFSFVSLAFSPDSSLLAGGGFGVNDTAIRLYDIAGGRRIRLIKGHTNTVQRVAFTADGKRLLSDSSDKSWRLIDLASGKLLASARLAAGKGGVQSSELSPDETVVAAGSIQPILRLWSARNGKLLKEWHSDPGEASTLAWAPDNTTIAYAGGEDGTIYLWHSGSEEITGRLTGHTAKVLTLAYARDGRSLISGASDGSVRVWTLGGAGLAAQ